MLSHDVASHDVVAHIDHHRFLDHRRTVYCMPLHRRRFLDHRRTVYCMPLHRRRRFLDHHRRRDVVATIYCRMTGMTCWCCRIPSYPAADVATIYCCMTGWHDVLVLLHDVLVLSDTLLPRRRTVYCIPSYPTATATAAAAVMTCYYILSHDALT